VLIETGEVVFARVTWLDPAVGRPCAHPPRWGRSSPPRSWFG